MILSCCLIDDEPLALDLMESYVRKTPFLSLEGKYPSALSAMKELSVASPDVLFLDIQMPELSGMDFSKIIGGRSRIIFTTAFEQYALDSYKVNALDYLLKPISYADFLRAAEKALRWYEMARREEKPSVTSPDTIFVKSEYKLIQIDLDRILYIEGMKDYVKIYLDNEPHPVVSLMNLKALEDILPADRFIRVHRSFIVQKSQIRVIERNRIVFGKEYIPVSDMYKDAFTAFLNERSPVKR